MNSTSEEGIGRGGGVALKELNDISYEAKKTQLQTLMSGKQLSLVDLVSSKAGSESHDAWRLFSKAKNALEDGARLENLSWRLFHMKLTKENSKETSCSDNKMGSSPMNEAINRGTIDPVNTADPLASAFSLSPLQVEYARNPPSSQISQSYSESHTPPLNSVYAESIPHQDSHVKHVVSDAHSYGVSMNAIETVNMDDDSEEETVEPDISTSVPAESNLALDSLVPSDQKVCANCLTSNTVLWRRSDHGGILCNACGLFFKHHGLNRPLKLKTDVIRKRNRKSKKEVEEHNAEVLVAVATRSGRVPKSKSRKKIDEKPPGISPISPKQALKNEMSVSFILAQSDRVSVVPPCGNGAINTSDPVNIEQPVPIVVPFLSTQQQSAHTKKEYVTTGKRARPDSDQVYSNSSTPFMYIPTPASTLEDTNSAPSPNDNVYEMTRMSSSIPATAQTQMRPINIASGSFDQNHHQNTWQNHSSPFSIGSHFSMNLHQLQAVQNQEQRHSNTTVGSSFPNHFYSNARNTQSHSYASNTEFNQPLFTFSQPLGVQSTSSQHDFQKQPIFYGNASKQSLLFQGSLLQQNQHQQGTSYNQQSSSSLLSTEASNSFMTDIMNVSQLISNENPLGREELYWFRDAEKK